MSTDTQKRTVEEIVEAEQGSLAYTALEVHTVQVAAANFVDSYAGDASLAVDNGIAEEFFELCRKVGEFEVRL